MKSAWTRTGIALLAVAIIAAGGELYVRRKLPLLATPPPHPPCQQDPVLGWVNRQTGGEYPSLSANRTTIRVTNTADGRRITAAVDADKQDGRDQVVIVGDSLTYGYGLSNEETWPWLLQQETPCLNVLNYGVPGYGTYQSLLMLERVLPELNSPKMVIYGFLEHHLVRNMAPPAWQAVLAMNRGGEVALPYVDVDGENRLVRHPPVTAKQWPFSQSLAIVRLAEILYWKNVQGDRYFRKMDAAWQMLLTEMRDLCAVHDCRLVVLLYNLTHRDQKPFYIKFLELNGIEYIDGDIEMPPELMLEKDPTHPNHKAHAVWADIVHRHIFCRDGEWETSFQTAPYRP